MNQTLLLGTMDRIIGGVEIGNQHASKVRQDSLRGGGFACFTVHKRHGFQIGKYPHVSAASTDFDLSLVRMHHPSRDYTVKNRPICSLESIGLRCFQSIDRPTGQRKIEELCDALCWPRFEEFAVR